MHQTTIFIIQLYFINELLRLKVLVVNLRFYLRKRCQKTSCRAEVYAYAIAEVQVATKEDSFHDDYQRSLNLSYASTLHCCRMRYYQWYGLQFTLFPEGRESQKEMDKCGQTPEKQLGWSFVKLSFVLKAF